MREILRSQQHKRITHEWSGAQVYYLPEIKAYLKTTETGRLADLRRERGALDWLTGKLKVPRVLAFESDAEKAAILISEIEGITASDHVAAEDADERRITDFVQKAAAAMRWIHSISIDDCPLDRRLDAKLGKAWENIQKNLVDAADFEDEHQGKTLTDIYEELQSERPEDEDLVFTHGDLCLPNIILNGGEVAGFIDLDCAGVADRYQDIALFERSLRHNCRVEIDFEAEFCPAYGIAQIDRRKLDYYRKLDELF